jgi:hypothetical protein
MYTFISFVSSSFLMLVIIIQPANMSLFPVSHANVSPTTLPVTQMLKLHTLRKLQIGMLLSVGLPTPFFPPVTDAWIHVAMNHDKLTRHIQCFSTL